ncbi:MAG: hypothetical protein ACE15F_13840 [bacterium]
MTLSRTVLFFDTHKILIFFVPFFIYLINGREISSGDPTPTVFVAVNVVKHGTVFLDDLREYIPYHNTPYYVSGRMGHIVSNYPVFPGIMAAPVYAPFVWMGLIEPGDGDLVWKYLSKLSGALYTALSVLVMYLTLKRLTAPEGAMILSSAYGLGTALWPIAAQSLWQHGPSVFWWTVCLYGLVRAVEAETGRGFTGYAALSGLAAGCAVLCRTVNGIGAAGLCCGMTARYGRRAWVFTVPAAALSAALISYNVALFNSWKGGDSVLHALHWELDRMVGISWSTPLSVGLPGQLISPSRGIFVFSPFLLFALWGMAEAWRKPGPVWRLIAWSIPIPVLMWVVFGKYIVWWGGNSHYGPRYQIETYPFLMLYLAAVWDRLAARRGLRGIFYVLLAYSLLVQGIGAFCYPSDWAVSPVDITVDKGRLWDWANNQIWSCARSGIKGFQWSG